MKKTRHDLGPKGPLGTDIVVRRHPDYTSVHLQGTNHLLEWIHHFLPFAGLRERTAARRLAAFLHTIDDRPILLSGHSVGGTVAYLAARRFPSNDLRLATFGAKRPPIGTGRPPTPLAAHYRILGDIVPLVWPWRPSLPTIDLDYGRLSPIAAHEPRTYRDAMRTAGVLP